jgi:hypothetical protein
LNNASPQLQITYLEGAKIQVFSSPQDLGMPERKKKKVIKKISATFVNARKHVFLVESQAGAH